MNPSPTERKGSLRRMDSTMSVKSNKSNFDIMEGPFDPTEYIKSGLDEHDVLMYREIFNLIDTDFTGFISPNELRGALSCLGINVSKADLYNLICDYDEEYSGKLNFKDYLDAVSGLAKPCTQDNKNDCKRVFKKLSGGKDTLTQEDLFKSIRASGINYTYEDFEDMYKKFGLEPGSDITFEVFEKSINEYIMKGYYASESTKNNQNKMKRAGTLDLDDNLSVALGLSRNASKRSVLS